MTVNGHEVVIPGQRARQSLTYTQLRVLLLSAGVLLLGMTAAVNYVRRVETAEVVAILLFMPIFAALVLWDWRGGAAAAGLATAVYVTMRLDAIHAVGFSQFRGVIVSRSLAFFAFGIIGGLANRQLRASLLKLDLYDHVDDATSLYNARFFLECTDLELSRAHRYETLFSVALVDIPTRALDRGGRRQSARALRDIGHALEASVRNVDRAVHAFDGQRHRFAVVLPETGVAGAQIFTDRLAERLSELVGGAGVVATAITCPDDEATLQRVRAEFAAIDRREHPEHPPVLGVVAA